MQPPQIKQFSGFMNMDDPLDIMPPMHHRMARNGHFFGNGNNYRFQPCRGTTLVPNNLLATGRNECIGGIYDQVKQKVFSFIWNSNSRHTIMQYDVKTGLFSRLLQCFTDSQTDILNFSLSYPIASINILYTSDDIGDIIHWVARNNRPMKLNVKDALAGLYGVNWLEDYITVARDMPLIPPYCTYANDATVTINNLRNFYQFRYRWVYKDLTKSTWSPYSKIPSPVNPDAVAVETDPTKNNRIDARITTGNEDVVKIEIAYRISIVSTFSDDLLIITLDKAALGISSNTNYVYPFFNNSSYTYVDLDESLLQFDWCPRIANCQEFLNGNTIIYGGITELYDKEVDLDVTSAVTTYNNGDPAPLTAYTQIIGRFFEIFFMGTPNTGDTVNINVVGDNGDTNSYQYVTLVGDDATDVRDALVGIINAAIPSNGFFATNRTDINANPGLRVSHTGLVFVTGAYSIVYSGTPPAPPDEIGYSCYLPKSNYGFGLLYFDNFGVNFGVITNDDMQIKTAEITTTGQTESDISAIGFSLNHIPPSWAYWFCFVRTTAQRAISNICMVSLNTAKDNSSPVYAYFDITNIQTNQNDLPSYDFAKGDRLRVAFAPFGSAFTKVKDYPIIDCRDGMSINGSAATGTWIKIPYDADLVNFGTGGHEHYWIEAYTPAKTTDTGGQVYYEFGEFYAVGDPTLSTRYHFGQIQNQIPLVQPATFQFSRGDFYIRKRTEPITTNLSLNSQFYIFDKSISDKISSKVAGNGRTNVIDENAKETFFPTTSRWSLPYQQNTNINQTNRFYPLNFDEIDRQKGDIQRFLTEERLLYVYQNRGVGNYGVYSRYIRNNDNNDQLVTTDEIITTNNINYLVGEFGLGDQYTALCRGRNVHYFCDPVRGTQVRRATNGLDPISLQNKGQYWIPPIFTPYNKTWSRQSGGNSKIIMVYDYLQDECVFHAQAGTLSGNSILPYTVSFNELRNCYSSFFDYFPEWMLSVEDKVFSFKDGQMYIHDNTTKYSFFYGTQFYPSIQIVMNDSIVLRKVFKALTYQSNKIWTADTNGDITTSEPNQYTGLPQISQLIAQDFTQRGNYWDAALLRDANSGSDAREALINGDYLVGNYILCTLTYKNSDFSFIYLPVISWDALNRNF